MVVPDRVVQAQRLVALSPAVAGALVLLDDEGGHVELAQARAQRDAALSAADDEHVGLGPVAELGGLLLALLQPGLAGPAAAVFGALGPAHAAGLFMPLQLRHGGQQRPDAAVAHADVAIAAGAVGLDLDPALQQAVVVRHGLLRVQVEPHRLDLFQLVPQHVADLVAPLQGAQVPGEQHQVAPIAFVLEQRGDGIDVLVAQRGVQASQQGLQGGAGLIGLHV